MTLSHSFKLGMVAVAIFALTGCSNRTLGTAAGAAVGGTVGGLAAGTTGAIIGGVGGAVVGNQLSKKKK